MANSELPQLTATTTLAATDLLYVVVDPGGGGEADRKIEYEDLLAEIQTDTGSYVDYTPTVAQNGTRTKTIISAQWMEMGDMVVSQGLLTVTDAGTAGNAITVTLPRTAALNGISIGTGFIIDSGTATYMAVVRAATSGTLMTFYDPNGNSASGSVIGATPSFALANGDQIAWNITYKGA